MRPKHRIWAVFLSIMPSVCMGQMYEFEPVYEGEDFLSLGDPVINDDGALAFVDGTLDSAAIYVKNDQGLVIRDSTGPELAFIYRGGDLLSMNADEELVFLGQAPGDDQGPVQCNSLFFSSKSDRYLVERNCEADGGPGLGGLSVSDSGRVVFHNGDRDTYSIFESDLYSVTVVLGSADGRWYGPLQNEAGTIAATDFTTDSLVMRLMDGRVTTVATGKDGFCDLRLHSLNNSDVLLFSANDCRAEGRSIYRYTNGRIDRLVSDSEPGTNIDSVADAYINNVGDMILFASQRAGKYGVFSLTETDVEPILITGQTLDGDPISSIRLSRHAFNDRREIAIWVGTTDPVSEISTSTIYVASVVDANQDTPPTNTSGGGGAVDYGFVLILFGSTLIRLRNICLRPGAA